MPQVNDIGRRADAEHALTSVLRLHIVATEQELIRTYTGSTLDLQEVQAPGQ